MKPLLTALFLTLPLPAVAQVVQCLDAGGGEGCIGQMTDACIASRPDGETTVGMTQCIQQETAAWDAELNAAYQRTRASFRDADASGDVGPTSRSDALLAAQRAWITYRDAECALQYARWDMGSMRNIAGANCLMGLTAERTIELRDMLSN